MTLQEALDIANEAQQVGDASRRFLVATWLDIRAGRTPSHQDELDRAGMFGDGELIDDEARLWLIERELRRPAEERVYRAA